MTPRWLTRLVRRNVASVHLYGLLRSGMLAAQWLARRPDEPDLLLLAKLPRRENELVVDIGANGGQSAVALGFIRPHASIVSYEPISMLWPELARIKRLLGDRFQFRRYALGRTAGTFPLFIPISGELAMTTRASISREAADTNCRELEQAVGLPTRIQQVRVEVREGDAENLEPAIIKIDVEGAEFEVIQGLRETIARCRPVVILERSQSFDDCARFFSTLGYDLLTSDAKVTSVRRCVGLSDRNWIACPPEMTRYFVS